MTFSVPTGNFIDIKVGGSWVGLPDPSNGSGQTEIATNVSEGRNSKGNFVGGVVGEDKIKVELSWNLLPASTVKTLFSRFDRKQSGKFVNDFRFTDPRYNTKKEFRMYCSNRSSSPVFVDNGVAEYCKDVKVSLVEV